MASRCLWENGLPERRGGANARGRVQEISAVVLSLGYQTHEFHPTMGSQLPMSRQAAQREVQE